MAYVQAADRAFEPLGSVPQEALPDLQHCHDSFLAVFFGVDLSHIGLAVAKEDLGGFDAELLPQLGGRVVADPSSPMRRRAGLVGMPAVGPPPHLELGLLLLGQPVVVLGPRLVVALGQGLGDGPAVDHRVIAE